MAEAEDVITDVARHATVFARDLWRRHRPARVGPRPLLLADVAERLDLLLSAVFGRGFPLRTAQAPAPATWLGGWLSRDRLPPARATLPATDGHGIWLPAQFGAAEGAAKAVERFRTLALQQAMRATRGSAVQWNAARSSPIRELYLLLEARAADDALVRLLPGLARPLQHLRSQALRERPPLAAFSRRHRRLEELARWVLAEDCRNADAAPPGLDPRALTLPAGSAQVLAHARTLSAALPELGADAGAGGKRLLWRDVWTGDLRPPPAVPETRLHEHDDATPADDGKPPRSARLTRRPEVREAPDDEDDRTPGAWMVQPSPPHEQAEDPMGLQRPTDRDTTTAAEDFADAMSELPEARLVFAPGAPKEVLLSDDPPPARSGASDRRASNDAPEAVDYPEWDWRTRAYRQPGARVLLLPAPIGPKQWVEDTLKARRGMLDEIRRRFEILRARRVRLRKQLDGDEIDLQAYIESHADFHAGLPMAERLYQRDVPRRRDMAIVLLIDISGSTDGWIATDRRVIDVAREALLLVCVAMEGLGEPYSVLAFSGESRHGVVVRTVKGFGEPYGDAVARRIAGLEPEKYTRAGAAVRHATHVLLGEDAEHRLLLLLSDGKPNDVDEYEGRYGVEDLRQAVTEARLQGVSPFCLTIDRQAASYLPLVFGPHRYALLPRPESLPLALLDWLRRLVQ